MDKIQEEDIKAFANNFKLYDGLNNSTILITGATGLIGSTLVLSILELNKRYNTNIKLLCPVRNAEKAKILLGENNSNLYVCQSTFDDFLANTNDKIDYLIHCASPTASKFMTFHPVETYTFIVDSTHALLEYAKENPLKGMVYVSSLEYYGQILDDAVITEDKMGYVDPKSPRSSYPLGKRAAEFACVAYAKEYNVPVKIARLTQTFGAGISKTDNRVFAQFARAAINGTDIILKSSGKSSKPYCYTTDAINAILTILLNGVDGEAYNVSNDETYISINDMANLVKENFNPSINIKHEIDVNSGYAPDTLLKLSSAKLQALGWCPKYNLKEMYQRLIKYLL